MTPATEFYTYAIGCMAAVVVVLCLLALALRLWERRLTGPITDDLGADEYAEAADREWQAITAAVDPDFAMWEVEVSS